MKHNVEWNVVIVIIHTTFGQAGQVTDFFLSDRVLHKPACSSIKRSFFFYDISSKDQLEFFINLHVHQLNAVIKIVFFTIITFNLYSSKESIMPG